MDGKLTIGRLAREADVNVETIRYYQRRGLVDEPSRPMGGHRHYAEAAIRRVRRRLAGLIGECAAGRRPRSCPIIATLTAKA